MLTNMSLELQPQHRNIDAHVIIMCLKELFDETSKIERYRALKEFFYCKMKDGSFVNTHVLKMICYFEKLG